MGAYDRDYWKEPQKNTSQKESDKIWKRLKGLDEPTNKQIANKKQLDAIMNELYKTSKTYDHNQKLYQANKIVNKVKEPLFIRILRFFAKLFIFCGKCIVCFIIGAILITIIYLVLH